MNDIHDFVCSHCHKPLTEYEIDSDECFACHNVSTPETDDLCMRKDKFNLDIPIN